MSEASEAMKRLRRLLLGIACLLLAASCDNRSSAEKRLEYALKAGDTNFLHAYLVTGGDVNRCIMPGAGKRTVAPLLDYALHYGRLDTVDFLLRRGANPNLPDGVGDTPLIWAVRDRSGITEEMQVRIVKRLLQARADPNLNASSSYRYTPLLEAALRGHSEIVRILIAAGADVNATNAIGQSALHLVDDPDVALLLIGAGASRTSVTVDGETPLDEAIRRRKSYVMEVLTNVIAQTNR